MAWRAHQLKFLNLVLIRFSNSVFSSQHPTFISFLHLISTLLALLDYFFMSVHQKKMILLDGNGVKAGTGAL